MKLYISTVWNSPEAVPVKNSSLRSTDDGIAWKIILRSFVGYTDEEPLSEPGVYELHVPQGLLFSVIDEFYVPTNNLLCENINQRAYDHFIKIVGLPEEILLIKFEDVIFDHMLKSNIISDLPPSEITAVKPIENIIPVEQEEVPQENIGPQPMKEGTL